jgi:hypothetical protein
MSGGRPVRCRKSLAWRAGDMTDRRGGREVLIEFQQIGNVVKVTAVDPETLTEVSIMGPPSAGQEILKRNVINKLNYVLSKKDKQR